MNELSEIKDFFSGMEFIDSLDGLITFKSYDMIIQFSLRDVEIMDIRDYEDEMRKIRVQIVKNNLIEANKGSITKI